MTMVMTSDWWRCIIIYWILGMVVSDPIPEKTETQRKVRLSEPWQTEKTLIVGWCHEGFKKA